LAKPPYLSNWLLNSAFRAPRCPPPFASPAQTVDYQRSQTLTIRPVIRSWLPRA